MKKEPGLFTGTSETASVDEFMKKLQHPMHDVMQYLRQFILSCDKNIGEGIYWNAPTFYFTGKMKPFIAKEYRRYIVGFNFYRQDTVRLIFLRGANATGTTGILEGDYKDGRRIVSLRSMEDVKSKEAALKKIIKQLVKLME
jgi:hypothetical protein